MAKQTPEPDDRTNRMGAGYVPIPEPKQPWYKRFLPQLAAPVYEVVGYDASAYNGDQDATITKTKAQFAILRGGYGNAGIDARIDYYRSRCQANGIEYGIYWYCKPSTMTNWKQHATTFFDVWRAGSGKLPPVIDAETTALDKQGTSDWLYKLANELGNLTGLTPMIYTSAGWWNTHCARADWPKQCDLFVAHWTTATAPVLPWDWSAINQPRTWTFWQHSAEGNRQAAPFGFTNGDDDLDMDRFNGNCAAFNIKYGANIKPLEPGLPPPPPGTGTKVKTKVALNPRTSPVIATSTDAGNINAGFTFEKCGDPVNGFQPVKVWLSAQYLEELP